MRELMSRTDADIETYSNSVKDSYALANIIHDGLVQVWDQPQADYLSYHLPDKLGGKHKAWSARRLGKIQGSQVSPELGESVEEKPKAKLKRGKRGRSEVSPELGESTQM